MARETKDAQQRTRGWRRGVRGVGLGLTDDDEQAFVMGGWQQNRCPVQTGNDRRSAHRPTLNLAAVRGFSRNECSRICGIVVEKRWSDGASLRTAGFESAHVSLQHKEAPQPTMMASTVTPHLDPPQVEHEVVQLVHVVHIVLQQYSSSSTKV